MLQVNVRKVNSPVLLTLLPIPPPPPSPAATPSILQDRGGLPEGGLRFNPADPWVSLCPQPGPRKCAAGGRPISPTSDMQGREEAAGGEVCLAPLEAKPGGADPRGAEWR